ncbi:MAG TPA: iron-sulfur cluster assembly accessory protein [Chloroflexota bacterium]|jgi:iron-sulfur cluster assembly protein
MINVSDKAAAEMKRFIAEAEDPETAVHIFVESACHCGAAHYGMALGSEIPSGANIQEMDGIRLVVDSDSAPQLEGAEIDFRDSMMGRGFVISNPNIERTGCGCGG